MTYDRVTTCITYIIHHVQYIHYIHDGDTDDDTYNDDDADYDADDDAHHNDGDEDDNGYDEEDVNDDADDNEDDNGGAEDDDDDTDTLIHTYTGTHMHTCTHAHIHTHTHSYGHVKKRGVFGGYAPGGMRQNPPRTSGTSKVSVRPILQRGMRQGFREAELRYAPRLVPGRPNASIDSKSCTRVCARVCAGAFTWSCRGVPGCAPGYVPPPACTKAAQCIHR